MIKYCTFCGEGIDPIDGPTVNWIEDGIRYFAHRACYEKAKVAVYIYKGEEELGKRNNVLLINQKSSN